MKKTVSPRCAQCGLCCKLFLINITREEWASHSYKTALRNFDNDDDFSVIETYGGNILEQKKDGSCIYLKNNTCSIHTRRPQACRNFFCVSKAKKFQGMIDIIKKRRKDDRIRSC